MLHVRMSHVTHVNDLCHTYEWVISQTERAAERASDAGYTQGLVLRYEKNESKTNAKKSKNSEEKKKSEKEIKKDSQCGYMQLLVLR